MNQEFAERQRPLATHADLDACRAEVLGKFDDLDRRIDGALERLSRRLELAAKSFRTELATGLSRMEVKIAGAEARLTRWVFTCILGQSAIFASALYFAFTHSR